MNRRRLLAVAGAAGTTLMKRDGPAYGASIPASYTSSAYPLQYYFEVKTVADGVLLHPGLGEDLLSQPYFVISRQMEESRR
jgi:hypothetical protein